MWEYMLSFLQNDITMILKFAVGIILVAHKLPTRKGIAWRVLLTVCVSLLWSFLFQYWSILDPASILFRSILKYLCIFVLAFLCTIGCYRITTQQALFSVTVGYCLEHIAQRLQGFLWRFFTDVPMEIQRFTELGVSALLDTLLYFTLIRHFLCREGDEKRNSAFLAGLSIVVAGTDIVLSTWAIDLILQGGGNRDMLYLINVFSIVISILVLIISMCDIRMKNAEREQYIVRQLLHNEHSQYRQENAIRNVINIKCHDLKHQIAMVGTKLDRQELADIENAIDIYDSSIMTGNTALDVVLCNKSLLCKAKGISLTVIADGHLIDFMRDTDIYSLFGNILDNAIYSTGKLEEENQRQITLTVSRTSGFAFIHEENYFNGEISFSDGLPQTAKEDKTYHGFGMLSIRTLAEKYEGDLKISAVSKIFKLDILLPLPA